jgi:predicted Rossmann fold flavoprotein
MTDSLIIIGGGASGFFCAVNAARLNPDLKIIILEKSGRLLSKVRVSGGGRCNITHACFDIDTMSKKYPRGNFFVKKMFHHFFTRDTIDWFSERKVELKTEEDGRMFPVSNSSQTIIDCLIKESNKYCVEIRMNTEVRKLNRVGEEWQLETAAGHILKSRFVCIACGGYPKTAMFDWLKAVGHSIEEPVPSLFTFNLPANEITRLMGVSLPDTQVSITGSKLSERNALLITHWGLSGPAILRLSAWGARELAARNYRFSVLVNWVPVYHEQSLREKFLELRKEIANQKIVQKNPFGLPQRLWEYLVLQSGITEITRWADLPLKEQNRLIKNLVAQEFSVQGKTTFKEEFTTAGGIRLSEIDPNSMQSKMAGDLFFAGEILDVDGITGGFNFQHAWSSGFIAGREIARLASPAPVKVKMENHP